MPKRAYYYDLCCKHKGKVVRIYDHQGREYVGRIADVDHTYVWLEPVQGREAGFGFGYYGGYSGGYYGGYYGGRSFFFPVALAAIGGFALGSAFFW